MRGVVGLEHLLTHGLLAAMNIYNGLDLKKTLRSAKDEHEAQQEID
ncbi:MAG: hypothetical protein R2865_07215 [Deinococcales bacterium]